MRETAFELDGVSKTYRLWWRLRRVPCPGVRELSVSVPRGLIFGLLGLNGAGKTTAMKLMVGLLRPDSGTIRVLGGDAGDPGIRARIGFLPELPYLPQQLGSRELLSLYGRMSGLSGRLLNERIDRSLKLAGLDPARREPIRYLSKGMRQRVAFAQVLLHEPEAIFVDEPMAGLDPKGIREMRELLLALKARGVTVCLCSHQIAEVERLCDRVAIMAGGRIVREGSVGEMLALAGARRYRLTVLVPTGTAVRARKGTESGEWRIQEVEIGEEKLASALAAQQKRGARVLQILAQQGSLEEVLLQAIRQAGG